MKSSWSPTNCDKRKKRKERKEKTKPKRTNKRNWKEKKSYSLCILKWCSKILSSSFTVSFFLIYSSTISTASAAAASSHSRILQDFGIFVLLQFLPFFFLGVFESAICTYIWEPNDIYSGHFLFGFHFVLDTYLT